MALYLGSNKVKVTLDNTIYNMNIGSIISINKDEILLASSDDYILQDINGLYLAPKEEN